MKTLLRPYEGTLPYLFVSYAHKNDAAVLEIISTLQSRGFRVWYDEGIEAGSEWPESIASHLERAQLVLAFLSPAYLRSDNCRKEMHYALTKRKPVINVYLEPTELSPGMEMQIGNLFALMKYTYPSEEYFYDKLFSAELLDAGKFAGEPPELPDAPAPAKKAKEKTPRGESPRRARREKPAKAPKPARPKKRRRGLAAAIIAVVLVGCGVGYMFLRDDGRIVNNLYVAGVDLSGMTKEEVKLLGQDIRFIKLGSPQLRSVREPFLFSAAYWVLFFGILILFAMVYVALRRQIRESQNVALLRGKRANKVAVQRFRAAKRYMEEQNRHAFYEEMLRALWGYMSDKFNIPVANLTKENVREELHKRGVSSEESQRFTAIITKCDEAQYSPAASARMTEVYGEGVDIISRIEAMIKR